MHCSDDALSCFSFFPFPPACRGDEEEEADIQASDAELAGIWNVRQVMSFLYRVVHASNIVEKFEKAEG